MTDAPLTADELAAIRARHVPPSSWDHEVAPLCRGCHRPWPCDTARVLPLVDLLRDDVAARVPALAAARDAAVSALDDALCARQSCERSYAELRATYDDEVRKSESLAAGAERAQVWAAAWKAAAQRRRADHEALVARAARAGLCPAETAAVVEAARAVDTARRERRGAMDEAVEIRVFVAADVRYGAALEALSASVAAYDAALREVRR